MVMSLVNFTFFLKDLVLFEKNCRFSGDSTRRCRHCRCRSTPPPFSSEQQQVQQLLLLLLQQSRRSSAVGFLIRLFLAVVAVEGRTISVHGDGEGLMLLLTQIFPLMRGSHF